MVEAFCIIAGALLGAAFVGCAATTYPEYFFLLIPAAVCLIAATIISLDS